MSETFTPGADKATRHIVVTTEAYTMNGLGGPLHTFPVAKGLVTWVGMLGQTQIKHIGPPMPMSQGRPVGALIEHATAEVGEILSDHEVAQGIATAAAKQAQVAAAIAARAKVTDDERKAAAAKAAADAEAAMQARVDAAVAAALAKAAPPSA